MSLGLAAAIAAAVFAVSAPQPVHVEVNGVQITRRDFANLLTGILSAVGAQQIRNVVKPFGDMPPNARCLFYAGRDSATGREIIWTSGAIDKCGHPSATSQYVAAFSLAALDAGFIKEPWRSLYRDAGTDDARQALGVKIARSIDEASDRQGRITQKEITWLSRNIRPGVSRAYVYDALRSRGLIAYNYSYRRGISDERLKSCTFKDDTAKLMPESLCRK